MRASICSEARGWSGRQRASGARRGAAAPRAGLAASDGARGLAGSVNTPLAVRLWSRDDGAALRSAGVVLSEPWPSRLDAPGVNMAGPALRRPRRRAAVPRPGRRARGVRCTLGRRGRWRRDNGEQRVATGPRGMAGRGRAGGAGRPAQTRNLVRVPSITPCQPEVPCRVVGMRQGDERHPGSVLRPGGIGGVQGPPHHRRSKVRAGEQPQAVRTPDREGAAPEHVTGRQPGNPSRGGGTDPGKHRGGCREGGPPPEARTPTQLQGHRRHRRELFG